MALEYHHLQPAERWLTIMFPCSMLLPNPTLACVTATTAVIDLTFLTSPNPQNTSQFALPTPNNQPLIIPSQHRYSLVFKVYDITSLDSTNRRPVPSLVEAYSQNFRVYSPRK